jgi:hypothetical protein
MGKRELRKYIYKFKHYIKMEEAIVNEAKEKVQQIKENAEQ